MQNIQNRGGRFTRDRAVFGELPRKSWCLFESFMCMDLRLRRDQRWDGACAVTPFELISVMPHVVCITIRVMLPTWRTTSLWGRSCGKILKAIGHADWLWNLLSKFCRSCSSLCSTSSLVHLMSVNFLTYFENVGKFWERRQSFTVSLLAAFSVSISQSFISHMNLSARNALQSTGLQNKQRNSQK